MWAVGTLIEQSLSFSLENIILIILTFGGLIFYAKDFTLGLMLHFFAYGLTFLGFLALDWYWINALIACLIFFVLMSMVLYFTERKAQIGGFT